ncbi:MAG: SAM-dependent methyltransferase, partial [Pseudomonadota bacterium]|nr:SAM-dependent methyltransferase [Pseudomonadota bacterium]
MQPGTLHLIPTPLGPTCAAQCLPLPVIEKISRIRHFAVEQSKTARAFLNQFKLEVRIQDINIQPIPKHASPSELETLLLPVLNGEDMGILSEAGCPAIADPGSDLVRLAHSMDIPVYPHIGPSSILLALMASGLNGQQFTFHGYLPIPHQDRHRALLHLETVSAKENITQIFIETPYRNHAMLDRLLTSLQPDTHLAVACDLSLPTQWIQSRPIHLWKSMNV